MFSGNGCVTQDGSDSSVSTNDVRVEGYKQTTIDKQSGTEVVSGYVRNRENRCQKCLKNRSAEMATTVALMPSVTI